MNLLRTKQEREKWEDIFNVNYIQPLLSNLDVSLSKAMDHVVQDTGEGMVFLEIVQLL